MWLCQMTLNTLSDHLARVLNEICFVWGSPLDPRRSYRRVSSCSCVKHWADVMVAEETKDTQKLLTRRRCWVLCVVRSLETLLV